MKIAVISETDARRLVTLSDAIGVIQDALEMLSRGDGVLFPSVRGHGSQPGTRFGVKAGYRATDRLPGLKVGSYWPGNVARGLEAHGSTTLLLDDDTGFPKALVAATYLNALRTAASDAVAVRQLSRPESRVLTIVGSGNQAYWDALAVAQVRALSQVWVCGRNAAAAETLATRLAAAGLPARATEIGTGVTAADIICTVTASKAPLFPAALVRPGTHISAMGADGPGKQELDPALFERADLWADAPDQSVVIGEFQHASPERKASIKPLGLRIAGELPGRQRPDDITLYDSSGVALQDLAIAAFALERASATGAGLTLDLG